MTPEDMVGRLLYRDGLMLIVDKPAGLAVHKGPKGGESLEDWFDVLRFGLPRSPSLAHRLDRDTSGCLVLGRHRKALAELSLLFRHGKVSKTYWAIVEGGPQADEGRIDLPLGKRDDNRGWWMRHDPNGLPSATTWKVMGRTQPISSMANLSAARGDNPNVPSPLVGEGQGGGYAAHPEFSSTPLPNPPPQGGREPRGIRSKVGVQQLTWLALEPLTGRTHQLRVHCAETGFPIVGDNIYGTAPRHGGPPLQLHAREIAVPLYKNRPPIVATAAVPPQLQERLTACGWKGEETTSPALSRPHAEEAAKRPSRSKGSPPSFETRASPAPQDEGGEK